MSRGFSSQPTDVDGGSFLGRPRQSSLFFHVVHQGVEQGAVNGITIDAELNSYLLESIFFPKSALHDGGVVVQDDRIVAASCLFPLSQSADIDKRLGTRHRAALGLSEETDAMIVVVSEETGRVSTASGGALNHNLTLEQLEAELDKMFTRSSAS